MKKKGNFTKISHNFFERAAWNENFYVCGLDEAGRGPLAGPVVAAAVILPLNTRIDGLVDSKALSEAKRNTAYEWITSNSTWAAAFSSNTLIDKINIYAATIYAMKAAYNQAIEKSKIIFKSIKFVLSDAVPLKINSNNTHEKMEFYNFNFGESKSESIAAASIVAKVTRDQIIKNLISPCFPKFQFPSNKGYGTASHTKIINELGRSSIHRESFKIPTPKNTEIKHEQTRVF